MKTVTAVLAALLLILLCASCGEKTEQEQTPEPEAQAEETISYISEEVSFGVFFDEKGTQREITLEKGQKEIEVYIFVRYPDYMGIAAVEYRIELPEGVRIWSDRFYEKRNLMMGTFEHGITEGFHCVSGPELLLHVLTLGIEKELENAVISLLPSHNTNFIGVAKCDEAYTEIRAGSFKAVINPTE
jgi:hypothetical protein